MYYRKALAAAGFDPNDIKDAQVGDEFVLHIGPKELKGSEIGNPMKCAGAKACMAQQHAVFAWVGASMAILGFADRRLIRFFHNGQLPQKHDQGMFAVGDYKFKHVPAQRSPALRKLRQESKSTSPKTSRNIRKGIIFKPSLAAQMRRGAEVNQISK